MTEKSVHPEMEIQDLLDGRLSPEQSAELEAHLAGCGPCRSLRDALSLVRGTLRAGVPTPRVPGEVVAGVAALLDHEVRRDASPDAAVVAPGGARRSLRVALGVGLAAAAVVAAVLWLARPVTLPSAASRDFARVRTGALALSLETENPGAMEAFFIQQGLPFSTRVFDLGMMGYRLAGGSVHTLAGRPSALFAYRGPDRRTLVCEMYRGALADLPRPSEVRRDGAFEFRIYRRGERTVVFWQEGAIVCVLVGDAAPEDVIRLAQAKAMKAS